MVRSASRTRARAKARELESREDRIAKNEVLFRDVNERVKTVDERLAVPADEDGRWAFICECADIDCADRIELTLREYDKARSHPAQFFIVPEHVVPDIERIVFRNERFAVVEKHPGGREIAEATDPRRQ